MNTSQPDIIIIGAGLTGLTAAYYLQKAGKKVMLIEQNNRPGGVIRTISEDGFTYEAGPNTGVISSAELVQLFHDLKLQFEVPDETGRTRWIWKKGKWHALPTGLISAIFTPLFTFKDKIRVLGEPFRRKRHRLNESVAKFVKRRLGKSFLRYAVDPFISGIYAGDPKKLIVRFALPKLYTLEKEYGSLVKGAIRRRKIIAAEKSAGITKSVFSVKGGLEKLIQALVTEIGKEHILTDASDVRVESVQDKFVCTFQLKGEKYELVSKKMISTVNGFEVTSVFPSIPEVVAENIRSIRYAKVVQVVVGYKRWKGISLDAFGGLIPSKEKKDILGILFPSALFQQRAPEGGALLSVFLGGILRPDIFIKSDEELKKIVYDSLKEMMQCSENPDLIKIFRYEKAIPQYEYTTELCLFTLHEIERTHPGLIIAGNMYDGIGMSDRVRQAMKIANQLLIDER
jgi:oxygen-dependent protoporphyrinogen oxidase